MSSNLTLGLFDKLNVTTEYRSNHTDAHFGWLSRLLNRYILSVIVWLGVLFNTLFVLSSLSSTLRKLAPISFLAAIAVCDMATQLVAALTWISQTFQTNVYDIWGVCQLFQFAAVYFGSLSALLGAAMTILNLIWLKTPLGVPSLFQARCVICGIAFVNVYLHSYMCWIWEVSVDTDFKCAIHANNIKVFLYFHGFGLSIFLISFLVQFVICLITPCLVGRKRSDGMLPQTRRSRGRRNEADLKAADRVKAQLIIRCVAVGGLLMLVPFYAINLSSICGHNVPSYAWYLITGTISEVYIATKPAVYFFVSPKVRESFGVAVRRCRLLGCCGADDKASSTQEVYL